MFDSLLSIYFSTASRELRSVVAHNRNIVNGSADDCQRPFNVCCMNIERIPTLLAHIWFLLRFFLLFGNVAQFFSISTDKSKTL